MPTLLDAHVKGSLPSGTLLNRPPAPPTNPLDTAPSSPQQIYLNLLILEASLRSQYLALTLRRRKYTFFFVLLILWTSYFTHRIFVHGPSPYYYISILQKLAWGAGLMTLAIFWLSGLYRKTLVFPRKFVGNTNKGLRQFNIKLVSVPLSWWERAVGWLVIFPVVKWIWPWCPALPHIPPGELEVEKGRSVGEVLRGFLKHGHHGPPNPAHAPALPPQIPTPGRKRRPSQASRLPTPPPDPFAAAHLGAAPMHDEEPLQPSGSHVKLVILPKGFSPDFREGWEIYRTDYWDKENERRALLRRQIRAQQPLMSWIFFPTPSSIRTSTSSTTSTNTTTNTTAFTTTPAAAASTPTTTTTTTSSSKAAPHHHHLHTHPSRRGTPEPPSRSHTPDPPPSPDDNSPPRRSSLRRSSTASLTRPHRRSPSSATPSTPGTPGTPTPPPPMMAPLTPLRAELELEGEVSDAGSVRSLAGSMHEGVAGAGGKARRGGKRTRGGGKRGAGAGAGGRGVKPGAGEGSGSGSAGTGAGAGTPTGTGGGSLPGTPA